MLNKSLLIIMLGLIISSCGTFNAPYYADPKNSVVPVSDMPQEKPKFTLYLAGDAGELDDKEAKTNFVLQSLKGKLDGTGDDHGVVFLGDNLYPKGLVPKGHPDRELGEATLRAQVEVVADSDAAAWFVAGNHDWGHFSSGGLKYLKRQAEFIEEIGGKNVHFYPEAGCGDPVVVKIDKDLTFIFVDSQWWLHEWENEKKMNKGCDIKTRRAFLDEMAYLFEQHRNDQIVVLMHHPIYSNGNHGGYYTIRDHLFPFLALNKNLYIPLPLIGSVYPTYRSITGHKQDIPHPDAQEFLNALLTYAQEANDVIFAAGHEHSLQYFNEQEMHFIVSGAASRDGYSRKGKGAQFVYSERGFSKLEFFDDGQIWLTMYSRPSYDVPAKVEYRKRIVAPRPETETVPVDYPWGSLLPETFVAAPNKDFEANKFKDFWLGEQYRDIWATEVEVPVINLMDTLGGLTPVKKGGGMASNTLRLENPEGKEYTLRSINKDYTRLLPEEFKNLKIINLMRDQNSASHPYGALMLPPLAAKAGIYYTTPSLQYLVMQQQLGAFNPLFEQNFYLLEERPDGDWSDHKPFGNSKEIMSYVEAIDNLQSKKRHDVDQQWVLKSRIFDMWIHDWDRHDDQWRWATFKEGDKTIYRPIPRDRDQAFYKFEGVIPRLISIYGVRKFKSMDEKIKDVPGLNYNARHFDRYFLNELEWEDWYRTVDAFQKAITDEDIENAFLELPAEVRDMGREELTGKLKKRRDDMMTYARRYYEFLNREVEIVGTNDKQVFDITRLPSGNVLVRAYTKDDGERILYYEREFEKGVTREIRIYGLEDKDDFIFRGEHNNDIRIRIIGGEDKDDVFDETGGLILKDIFIYDELDGIEIKGDYRFNDKRSADIEVNEYDRESFEYDKGLPYLTFGYTPDDRFWFGIGGSYTAYGWRKEPFSSKQEYEISFAPGSKNTLIFEYDGLFMDAVFGNLEFAPHISFTNPYYINYFGLGNNTSDTNPDRQYNWVRMANYGTEMLLGQHWRNDRSFLLFGPLYKSYQLINVEDRILDELYIDQSAIFNRDHFAGIKVMYGLEAYDNANAPTEGVQFHSGITFLQNLGNSNEVLRFDVDGSFYLGIVARPRIIFGTKAAFSKVYGDPAIYQYPALGNNNGLRAYRNERFRGTSSFVQMFDLRMHLFDWYNKYVPMSVGMVGGYDYGRVWIESESFTGSFSSYTLGLSLNLLDMTVIHPYYSWSDDNKQFVMRLGFSF